MRAPLAKTSACKQARLPSRVNRPVTREVRPHGSAALTGQAESVRAHLRAPLTGTGALVLSALFFNQNVLQ